MELRLRLPETFVLVPSDSPTAYSAWTEELVSARADTAITDDLARLAAAIAASTEPDRRWFAVVPPAPYRGGIAAFGWIRAGSANGITTADMQAEADADANSRKTSSLVTELAMHTVGTHPALLIHQFQPIEARDSTVLVERCGALMLDETRDLAVNLEITAVDLRTFQDVVATVLEILETSSVQGTPA